MASVTTTGGIYQHLANMGLTTSNAGTITSNATTNNATAAPPEYVMMAVEFEGKLVWMKPNMQPLKGDRTTALYAVTGTLKFPIPETLKACMDANLGLKEWAETLVVKATFTTSQQNAYISAHSPKITGISTNKKYYLIDFRATGMIQHMIQFGNPDPFPVLTPSWNQQVLKDQYGTSNDAYSTKQLATNKTYKKGWVKNFFGRRK